MTAPAWWMMWLDDGGNPAAHFEKKYGLPPSHIEVPPDFPLAAVKKLEAAGFKVAHRQTVSKGILLLGHVGAQEPNEKRTK